MANNDPAFIKALPAYLKRRFPAGGFGSIDWKIRRVIDLVIEAVGILDAGSIESVGRPKVDLGTVPSTIYVDALLGSDATGDGTAGLPYATFGKAYCVAPASPKAGRTIRCVGVGPYNFGGLNIHDLNIITVAGDPHTVTDTRTISSIGTSSEAVGLVIDDADTAMTVDEHRGKQVLFTSGALSGTYGVIAEHAANQVKIISGKSGATYTLPGIGDTYDILDWVTEFDFPDASSYVIESSSSSIFQDIKFTGTNKFLFCNDTDKIDFRRCRFEIEGILAGRGGSLFLTTCSVANKGTTFSDWGMVTSISEGIILFKNGTLIDAERATSDTKKFISALTVGFIETQGEIGFRGLATKGITIRGGGVVNLRARLGTLFSQWRFFSCTSAVRLNSEDEGWGWATADLPDMFGSITGDYAVVATGSARARLGAASNIATGTVPNAVSADDGATAVSRAVDGTIIYNGDPSFAEYTPGTPADWAATAPTTFTEALDRLAAATPAA